jgi:hypothetical protein
MDGALAPGVAHLAARLYVRVYESRSCEMMRIKHVKVLKGYRLELTFSDDTHGVADLSDLVGRGVFELWNDYDRFLNVHIGDTGELVWSDQVDLCPDSLYLRVTGKSPEDIFPNLRGELAHA